MLSVVQEIINPEVILKINSHNREILLKEDGKDSKLKKLYITNMPNIFLAFTLDHQPKKSSKRNFKQLSPYINVQNGSGVNKGCDLIVLWHDDIQFRALVFDLKSDKPNLSDTKKQLDNSSLFLNYILKMADCHCGTSLEGLSINKVIAVTNIRGTRKGPVYNPNKNIRNSNGFQTVYVETRQHQTGYISFSALSRQQKNEI